MFAARRAPFLSLFPASVRKNVFSSALAPVVAAIQEERAKENMHKKHSVCVRFYIYYAATVNQNLLKGLLFGGLIVMILSSANNGGSAQAETPFLSVSFIS